MVSVNGHGGLQGAIMKIAEHPTMPRLQSACMISVLLRDGMEAGGLQGARGMKILTSDYAEIKSETVRHLCYF